MPIAADMKKVLCNTTTIRLNSITRLIIKPRHESMAWHLDIYAKINLSTYKEVWVKENRHLWAFRRYGYVEKSNVEWLSVNFDVPIIAHWCARDNDTYIRWVMIPTFRAIKKLFGLSNAMLATMINQFIRRYSMNSIEGGCSTWECIVAYGGVCDDWAQLGFKIGKYLGWRVAYVVGYIPGESFDPASAFLCNASWWSISYAEPEWIDAMIKVVLRNGSILICKAWIDTGYAVEQWSQYRVKEVIIHGIPQEEIEKVIKLKR